MSNGIRVNVIVEGSTEQTFVRDLLQEPFGAKNIHLVARGVQTSEKHGRIHRGGLLKYEKAKRDIKNWLSQDRSAYVTTMFDLYRLPHSFPGFDEGMRWPNPIERVKKLEEALSEDIQNLRFIPYIQLHEFEGLLFSNVESIDKVLGFRYKSQLQELQKIRQQFLSPEEINDSEMTAPSGRLKKLYPGYDKPAFGSRIAAHIGLETLRNACHHFNEWLEKLESLTGEQKTA